MLSDNSENSAPIRNVSTSGMNKTQGGRSVGFSGAEDKFEKNKKQPNVTEKIEPKPVVDLEN